MVYDSTVPALAERITESGHKSLILAARFPGSRNQTRRYIGDAGGPQAISLAEARKKARTWLSKIGEGGRPERAEAPAGCQGGGEAGGTAGEVDHLQCRGQRLYRYRTAAPAQGQGDRASVKAGVHSAMGGAPDRQHHAA